MPLKNRLLYLMILFFLSSLAAQANEKIIRVGVAPGEPFVITTDSHSYQGIAVEIWQEIAKNLNLQYQFVPMSEHIDDDIQQLARGNVDVIIGPLVPTQERTELVDFTRPYYLNKIGIVVNVQKISFLHTLRDVVTSSLNWGVLLITALFLIYIHVFWFFERKEGYMDVEKEYWPGIKTVFLIHTLGISFNTMPTHAHTRFFRFIWFFVLILFLSTVSAAITSSLTVALSNNYTRYDKLSDFSHKTLAAVRDTAPYDLAIAAGLNVIPAKNRVDGMQLLLEGKVEGYVDYYPIADYYVQKHHLVNKLVMADVFITQNTFAFALPVGSPLIHSLDVQLSKIQANGQTKLLCQNLLTEKNTDNCEM